MTVSTPSLRAKDFASNQDVRWCPGCGDYSILKQVQTVLAASGYKKEEVAIISGIGCSSRFPYYTDTFGMHSIHGRAPAIATGLKIANPALSVWVVTGDGDGLSIGAGQLLHCLRRNVDVNIMLFNNQIYGLTKGQYSPTSEQNKRTKSTPMGSLDYPINPLAFAIGGDATFIARSMDRDPKHLQAMLTRADQHAGASFVEIYQNCNIFNDGAFFAFTDKNTKPQTTLYLEHGQPLCFGKTEEYGIAIDGFNPKIVNLLEDNYSKNDLWIHDEQDIFKAQILTRFFDDPVLMKAALDTASNQVNYLPRPFGVLFAKERPTYEKMLHQQIEEAKAKAKTIDLNQLISGKDSYIVKAIHPRDEM